MPKITNGVLTYEDSPLVNALNQFRWTLCSCADCRCVSRTQVRAVRRGRVVVVDEADKAPTHVTVILKALADSDGQLLLPDGRRIIMNHHKHVELTDDIIVAHPGFRMIILANRPGYPFMGNDFFKASGGAFATHAIDNADFHSEMQMLRKYAVPADGSGREVPAGVLKRLALSFADLRELEEAGTLTHSYSTRELVAATLHLAAFPSDGVPSALKGTFDFDQLRVSNAERDIIAQVPC